MALYDGFFDAAQDESTEEYDRAYGPGDFTGYFANIIGSGVCIHNNADSFKAEYEGGTLYLRPGYLFIQGYWLANKAGEGETNYKGYAVTLPANMTGSMAVVAHLNLGQRLIEIEVRPVSQAYPDALVLAIITTTEAEDTRHNTDICGVIETAGELSVKVEWALNYIDTEIDSKLQQVEQDIAAQDAKLDAKIAEVQAVADSIVPPPVGSIKFSASQNVGAEWIKCDGSFVNETDYPELVAALGKLIPSGDKFQLLSDGEIGSQITNGVLYGGRMWVYSYADRKLYGVDVEGTTATKEIAVSSENTKFSNFLPPTNAMPLTLSIVPHKVGTGAKLFLGQYLKYGDVAEEENAEDFGYLDSFMLFQTEFSGEENSISLSPAFTKFETSRQNSMMHIPTNAVPYVISKLFSGVEKYFTPAAAFETGANRYTYYPLVWTDGDNAHSSKETGDSEIAILDGLTNNSKHQRFAFSRKSKDELVMCKYPINTSYNQGYQILSSLSGLFDFSYNSGYLSAPRVSILPLNIVGESGVITGFTEKIFPFLGNDGQSKSATINISIPPSARVFIDAGAYLWGKDIYLIFVGTGIIFSRTLEEGSFGYLDTTSVLGTITQFGYLDYSQDEGTLYLLGQDTTNKVKVAKIVLNTLYDYANDGAWLPMIASDGVPAWIKAKEEET